MRYRNAWFLFRLRYCSQTNLLVDFDEQRAIAAFQYQAIQFAAMQENAPVQGVKREKIWPPKYIGGLRMLFLE